MRAQLAMMMFFLTATPTWAVTYKCQDAQGNWTEKACPDYQQRMRQNAIEQDRAREQAAASDASSTTPAAHAAAPAPKRDTAIQAISDETADYDCRSAAHGLVIIPDTTGIDRMKAQVAALESSQYTNAYTGIADAHAQDMAQADRIRAASLRGTIATEEQKNAEITAESHRAERDALAKCDADKASRDKARGDQ